MTKKKTKELNLDRYNIVEYDGFSTLDSDPDGLYVFTEEAEKAFNDFKEETYQILNAFYLFSLSDLDNQNPTLKLQVEAFLKQLK